jgi:hypothetical protein
MGAGEQATPFGIRIVEEKGLESGPGLRQVRMGSEVNGLVCSPSPSVVDSLDARGAPFASTRHHVQKRCDAHIERPPMRSREYRSLLACTGDIGKTSVSGEPIHNVRGQ